jgi:heme/copper-type cytochrome/quinol oxidase subunit 3
MSRVVAGDLSALPDHGFGSAGLGWWGVLGFMLIEGMGFVLAIAAYFYLMPFEASWPPDARPPDLLWGSLFTGLALLSEIPNVWLNRQAHAKRAGAVRFGLVLMTVLGLLLLGLRWMEFGAMNIGWDQNAYGSITWALISLHALHTATDLYDTGVLAVLFFARPATGRRFVDASDNALYWHFIVWSWVLLYVVIYWVPRWT